MRKPIYRAYDNKAKLMLCPKHEDDVVPLKYWMENDNVILMQFTGCTDCEGNKVFEGDIICDPFKNTHLIWFKDGCFVFVDRAHDKYFNGVSMMRESWMKEFDKKVVGNIFENFELNVWGVLTGDNNK
jgi:uncharacterized phage protein (TIGR01671 family)